MKNKSTDCFKCKYDFYPNYRLCIGKYKNFDHPCFVAHIGSDVAPQDNSKQNWNTLVKNMPEP